jgi:DHA1 family bicyclomycin/chloramphenicol resistance-like MFS transporter
VAGFCSGITFAYISGSSFVYINLYGVSEQHFGYFFGANACGLALAAQVNRLLLRRATPERILEGAFTCALVLALALAFCGATGFGRLPAIVVLLFLTLFCAGIAFPNLLAAVMAPFKRTAGSASALLGTVQFAMGGAAGALVGLLNNGTAFSMTGIVAASALGAFFSLRAVHRKRPA